MWLDMQVRPCGLPIPSMQGCKQTSPTKMTLQTATAQWLKWLPPALENGNSQHPGTEDICPRRCGSTMTGRVVLSPPWQGMQVSPWLREKPHMTLTWWRGAQEAEQPSCGIDLGWEKTPEESQAKACLHPFSFQNLPFVFFNSLGNSSNNTRRNLL